MGRSSFVLTLTLVIVSIAMSSLAPVQAYHPESPEVLEMVERAMKGLAGASPDEPGSQPLIALPFVKEGLTDHEQVKKAIAYVQGMVHEGPGSQEMRGPMYSRAVALIFLCELDPQQFKPEIEMLLQHFYDRQMPAGAWSYLNFTTGDTSQAQYGILALWTAQKAGFKVPIDKAERALSWFLRTQAASGGFTYQAEDPGSGQRIAQAQVSLGLSAAGTASLYVGADLCGLGRGDKQRGKEEDIPAALRLVKDLKEDPDAGAKKVSTNINREALKRGQADGNRFFDASYRIEPGQWQFYYLYTLERYMSFRESIEGGPEEPKWYNDGVEYLRATQKPDGTWNNPGSGAGRGGDTAFAIMFLTRSTKKKIAKAVAGDGALAGGKGLNGDMTKAKQRADGKIVAVPKSNAVDDLLNALEDPKNSDVEGIADLGEALKLDFKDPKRFKAQVDRVRALVSAEKFEVRLVAVRTLGKTDDFDNIPYLIYAVSDPDIRVARVADAGLRHITRKLDGVGMPTDPTDQQKFAAVQAWKQWYKAVNPSAIFLD